MTRLSPLLVTRNRRTAIDREVEKPEPFACRMVPVSCFLVLLSAGVASLAIASAAEVSSARLREERSQIEQSLESLPQWVRAEQSHGRLGFHGNPGQAQWIVIDLGEVVSPDEVVLFPALSPVDAAEGEGSGFPPEIEVEISDRNSFENAVRLGRWQEDEPGVGTRLPVLRFPCEPETPVSGRYLRLRVFGSRPRQGGRGRFYTFGEIVVLEKGRNVALHRPVETSGEIENAPRWQAKNLTDGFLWCLQGRGALSSPSNGFHSGIEDGPDHEKWVEVDLGEARSVDEIHLVPAHPQDFADTAGFGFPSQFRILGFGDPGGERPLFESAAEGFQNPGASTVMFPVGGEQLHRIRIEVTSLWQRTGDYLFALGELQVWSGGENVALGKPVRALDVVESGLWDRDALTDGFSSRRDLLSWTEWLDGLSRRAELEIRMEEIAAILERRSMENRQRWWIGSAMAVSVLMVGFAMVLLLQRRQAARSRDALRERIAHDLHDELGASLSALALQSDLARRQLSGDDPVQERLAGLSKTARTTLDDMRDVIWLLAPAADSWPGFLNRIESISRRLLEGVDQEFRSEGDLPAGSPPIGWAREWVMFFKEALTNARRHAEARTIDVSLEWGARAVRLQVRDDGRGFDSDSPPRSGGLGLKGLSRRSAALGGRMKIESSPGSGTLVQLEVPLPHRTKP